MHRFAAAAAPYSVEPDDLLQQAVANALARQPLHTYDNPGAYLRTAIANLARNEYRRNARADRRRTLAPTEDTYPSDLGDLERLRPEDRIAVYLIDVEGEPFRDVARYLGCTVTALKARVIRARRRLRSQLTEGVIDGHRD